MVREKCEQNAIFRLYLTKSEIILSNRIKLEQIYTSLQGVNVHCTRYKVRVEHEESALAPSPTP